MGDVVQAEFTSLQPIDPDQVLETAKGQLKRAFVLGYTKENGQFYMASSHSDIAEDNLLLDIAKSQFMAMMAEFDEKAPEMIKIAEEIKAQGAAIVIPLNGGDAA
jgi:hypothetical protein